MAFDFCNEANETFRISGGNWAVYLLLAEAFGYKLPGTLRPDDYPTNQHWHGRYDSSDGQRIPEQDALSLAGVLNSIFHHPMRDVAIGDTIISIEREIMSSGTPIPDGMRIEADSILEGFPHLMNFLCRGGFRIN